MPRDPFDIFFGRGGDRDNRDNGNRDRGINPNDPFDDPFFRQFSQMSQHMDQMIQDFFNDALPNDRNSNNNNNNTHTIIIDSPHFNSSRNRNSDNPSGNRPHLSQINPNIPSSDDNNINDNNNNDNNNTNNMIVERRRRNQSSFDDRNDDNFFSPFRIFDGFFGDGPGSRRDSDSIESYSRPSISDINPDFYNGNDNTIINDKDKDSNLIHPDSPPPGFRSPYLPNWNGAEKTMEMENSHNGGGGNGGTFFRSQSVVISTTPDGRTTKTTTIRDENGNIQESTETYDSDSDGGHHGFDIFGGNGRNGSNGGAFDLPRILFDFGFGNRNNNNNNRELPPPSLTNDILNNGENSNRNDGLMRPNDPFGRWRHSIDGWKSRVKTYWFGNRDRNYGSSYNSGSNNNNNNNSNNKGNNGNPIWFDIRNSKNDNSSNNTNNNNNDNEWFWKYRNNTNNNNNENNNNMNDDNRSSRIEWKTNHHNYRKNNNNNKDSGSKLRDEIIKPKE